MISPHLLKVVESFSSSFPDYMKPSGVKQLPFSVFSRDDVPVFVIESEGKDHKWCHMILAKGPVIEADPPSPADESRLIIVWWSKMSPDTERVLSVVDWAKHARNYPKLDE